VWDRAGQYMTPSGYQRSLSEGGTIDQLVLKRVWRCWGRSAFGKWNMRWEICGGNVRRHSRQARQTLRDLRPLLALAMPPPSSDTLIIYTISSRDNELYIKP